MNPVLSSLLTQRQEQLATMDRILEQVAERGGDLVEAERGILEATRARIVTIDDQITPLQAIEELRGAHAESIAALPAIVDRSMDRLPAVPRRADGADQAPLYRSAGEYLVDLVLSRDAMNMGASPDPDAARRVAAMHQRAVQNQTTTDTPGILPTPVVGDVVSLIDASRPLISSLGGAHALSGVPGKTFSRPKITQHTTVGEQVGEKTELPSQKMIIGSVAFNKKTYGGTVDISRQDIDWTSPSAWDILVRDLADVYSQQTETVVAADFASSATGTTPALPANPTLADWSTALYTAAMHSYQAGKRLPNRIWCSLDVWAALGALVDTVNATGPSRVMGGAAGTTDLTMFAGDMFGVPRIVVPTFPAKTCIVGPSALYEVYEEVIGLLSAVEPSILGVVVAYGGYLAYSSLAPAAFVKLNLTATVLPTVVEADATEVQASGGKSR